MDLLKQSASLVQAKAGSIVSGTVISVDRHGAWVNFGGKSEALVGRSEIGPAIMKNGYSGLFYVLESDSQQQSHALFSARRAQRWTELHNAMLNRGSVEVQVTGISRNSARGISGVTVKCGDLPGFIPHSLLEVERGAINQLLGQVLQVKVCQLNQESLKLIFNHKAALWEAGLANLKTGEIRLGRVVNIASYGAFIDIGQGLHGLVHRSQFGIRSNKPDAPRLKKGDQLQVKVISIKTNQDGKVLIDLSIKEAKKAEEDAFISKLKIHDVVAGTVSATVNYGVFIQLSAQPSLAGLIHHSEMDKSNDAARSMEIGQPVHARIIKIDAASRRIALSFKDVLRCNK